LNLLILRWLVDHRKAVIPSAAATAPDQLTEASLNRLVRASLLLLFSYVFLANAWMGDDAYITYRVVWNFVHGYGLTFNPDERVQAYTHPLWMLVISAAHFVTREFFFTGSFVSWAFDIATLVVLMRWARTTPRVAVLVFWLLTSKAFVDYTDSGLENPLSYFLIALFYSQYLSRPWGLTPDSRELRRLFLLGSLAFLNRPDAVLLFVLPLGELLLMALRRRPRRVVVPLLIGLAPALLWLAFATFYYGFPLPNTYYAKVANGIPRMLMYKQGFAYLLNSANHDPITLATIGLAIAVGAKTGGAARRAALSALVYVIYTVGVGGDFMSGRFFATPFLVAAMTVAPEAASMGTPWVLTALIVYNLLMPIVPIKTTSRYDAAWAWRTQNGIKDERGHYHQGTNILFYSPFRQLPDFVWVNEGTSFRNGPEKVTVQGSIGFYGLYAGPEKFLVDRNALSDPLLARMPVSPRLYFEFYAGHYFRDIPEGYLESVAQDKNLLTDPLLHDYYTHLRNVTRGPLFSASRFSDIALLNFGRYRNLHEQILKRRAIDLSIRADNERFRTDVGDRDTVAGALRANSGRAGYLQFGPEIPAARGIYRARWIGTVDAAPPTGAIGYVEIWFGPDRRIAREPVVFGPKRDDHLLATLDFTVPNEGVSKLDYRFFVNAGVRMTLERVELYSGTAIPASTP
jgi:arabinofuranosyltransferase